MSEASFDSSADLSGGPARFAAALTFCILFGQAKRMSHPGESGHLDFSSSNPRTADVCLASMEPLKITLPRSIRSYLEDLAAREGVTIEQFVASAATEKASALATESYLKKRAARARRDRYLAALDTAPDAEPPEYDRL